MTPKRNNLGAVVLAAGASKRFGGASPKVLHPLCGPPILVHVLETLRVVHRSAKISTVIVVVPPGKQIEKALAGIGFPFEIAFAVQKELTGTGAAAQIGLKKLGEVDEVLVLAGDMPLVTAESLTSLVRARRSSASACALLSATSAISHRPPPYGRILRSAGDVVSIVEAKDATSEQLEIHEVNLSTYAFDRDALGTVLPRIRADNAQGERYLTDSIGELVATGRHVTSTEGDIEESSGTNTREDFADVARIVRRRLVADLMNKGVTVVDPDTTYVDVGVVVGADTVLLPNTHLEGATKIGSGCEIGPSVRLVDTVVGDEARVTFAVAREVRIGPHASVGPFASLRPGTVLGRGAEIGSFAEMKNAKIGDGVKAHHFSYLGDVTVGRGTNIGAGTITCNYDGERKHATTIGEDAFIGSDSILVAPVRVGAGAYTGAGSVVNRDVKAGELVYGVPAKPRGVRGVSLRKAKRKSPPKKKAKRKGKGEKGG